MFHKRQLALKLSSIAWWYYSTALTGSDLPASMSQESLVWCDNNQLESFSSNRTTQHHVPKGISSACHWYRAVWIRPWLAVWIHTCSLTSVAHILSSDRPGKCIVLDVRYHLVSSFQITVIWNLNWLQHRSACSHVVAYVWCDVRRDNTLVPITEF